MVKSSQVAASEHTLHHQNDIQHGLFKIRFSISFHSDSAAGVLTSHEVKQESCLEDLKPGITLVGFMIVMKIL